MENQNEGVSVSGILLFIRKKLIEAINNHNLADIDAIQTTLGMFIEIGEENYGVHQKPSVFLGIVERLAEAIIDFHNHEMWKSSIPSEEEIIDL